MKSHRRPLRLDHRRPAHLARDRHVHRRLAKDLRARSQTSVSCLTQICSNRPRRWQNRRRQTQPRRRPRFSTTIWMPPSVASSYSGNRDYRRFPARLVWHLSAETGNRTPANWRRTRMIVRHRSPISWPSPASCLTNPPMPAISQLTGHRTFSRRMAERSATTNTSRKYQNAKCCKPIFSAIDFACTNCNK